jgi:hypothetical protein
MGPASNSTSQRSGAGLRVVAAVAVIVCASMLGAAAHAGTDAAVPAATLRDPAHDVRAGDIDLTSISVSKRDGALVVRFTVRGPVTDDVSYTASVRAGAGSWALVARRSAGRGLLPALQPLDRGDNERHRSDRGPHREGQSADLAAGWADKRDVGPTQRLLPSRAGSRQER